MLLRLRRLGFTLAFLTTPLFAQTPNEFTEATSLLFRFTDADAIRMKTFLQERMSSKLDFTGLRYFGNLNSLACSERNVCYLWLSRKEWLETAASSSQEFQIEFTLPVNEAIFRGNLTVEQAASGLQNIGVQLQDLKSSPETLQLQSTACSTVVNAKPKANLAFGDCRIELSNALKKVLPYPASLEFVQNSENIALSFSGATAKKLFESMPAAVDPYNADRRRVQLGPQFYCWNLQPDLENKLDAYVCQGNYIQFSSPLSASNKFTDAGLQFNFAHFMADTITVTVDGAPVGVCPAYSKSGADLACKIFYNWKAAVDVYPIGNSVQGVAVGWGVAPPS